MMPKISINTLCLAGAAFDVHVAQVVALGACAIAPTLEEVLEFGPRAARHLLDDAGLKVATLTHRAFGFATAEQAQAGRARLDATVAVAETIGAQTITMTTGGRGDLGWTEAADRFVSAIAPCVARARGVGVTLSLEPTSHLYADISMAHRLSDTIALSRNAGIGVGIDLFACWFDADIEQAIAVAGPLTALVQVSDYVAGDRGLPCRAVPGDGMIPLRRLLPLIAMSGFQGFFDLEIIGPRIEENRLAELGRAGRHVGALLEAAYTVSADVEA